MLRSHEPRNLARPGALATATYLAALTIYALLEREAVLAMKPDEFADFLAGCFAPLAFLWLVLGFFQQGDELRNSVAALKLQGEELRNSVEQQRHLVEVTREQLGLERANQDAVVAEATRRAAPIFHISGGFAQWSHPIVTSVFIIRNIGATCRRLRFRDLSDARENHALFGSSSQLQVEYQFRFDQEIQSQILTIECMNELGQELKFQTELSPKRGQYGPEYGATAPDGLFAQIVTFSPSVENNLAFELRSS